MEADRRETLGNQARISVLPIRERYMMKKQILTIAIAVCGTIAVSCGGPSTPRAGRAISYDKIPPGERYSANIDGRPMEIDFVRENVPIKDEELLNHDPGENRIGRDPQNMPQRVLTNDADSVTNLR